MLKKRGHAQRENLVGLLFTLPALVPLIVFWMVPVMVSLGISFTDWDMMSPTYKIVGLKNYIALVREANFHKVLFNTLTFAVGNTVPAVVLGMFIALVMNKARKGAGIYRTVIFAPYITPMVAVSVVWSWIFEPRVGILNYVLGLLGMPASQWTQSSQTAMLSVLIVTVWKSLGWTMLFYMEAMRKVPQSYIEAATIDGANALRRFWHITLPMISPTTFFLVIMSTIGSLQAYDQIQVLTNGGPAGSTRTLLYFYYQEAFRNYNTGKASSVAITLVLITMALSIIETAISKKFVHTN